ncbi:uncharacterized protein LOC125439506 [Sphaerodactylus townsendi]|uniref:uncharacterized protein LOC125439506 n=1 Tax=Sphaerodactylus townsendi TaxID=933632 RepID=UPI00202633CA|nr:uncharacterized protein LOC125439506 [Sphaerodactylus townsendi]
MPTGLILQRRRFGKGGVSPGFHNAKEGDRSNTSGRGQMSDSFSVLVNNYHLIPYGVTGILDSPGTARGKSSGRFRRAERQERPRGSSSPGSPSSGPAGELRGDNGHGDDFTLQQCEEQPQPEPLSGGGQGAPRGPPSTSAAASGASPAELPHRTPASPPATCAQFHLSPSGSSEASPAPQPSLPGPFSATFNSAELRQPARLLPAPRRMSLLRGKRKKASERVTLLE